MTQTQSVCKKVRIHLLVASCGYILCNKKTRKWFKVDGATHRDIGTGWDVPPVNVKYMGHPIPLKKIDGAPHRCFKMGGAPHGYQWGTP